MALGDHLEVPRLFYAHHGLDLGNGEVMHYEGKLGDAQNGIKRTSMAAFADGGKVKIVEYENREHNGPDSARRAISREGETGYNLAWNNCEHFVTWCIQGKEESKQVRSVVATAVTHIPYGKVLAPFIEGPTVSNVLNLAGSVTIGAPVVLATSLWSLGNWAYSKIRD